MRIILFVCAIALCLFIATPSFAQWFIGIPIEVKTSWLKGKQVVILDKDTCHCSQFVDGTSNGSVQNANIFVGYNLHDKVILSMQLGYYNPGMMTSVVLGDRLPSLVERPGKSDTVIYSSTQHRLEYTLHYLTTEIAARVNLLGDLYVIAGASFDVAISSRQRNIFRLVEPENARFPDDTRKYENNGRDMILNDQSPISGLNIPRIGVVSGLSYVFTVAKKASFAPFIRYDYQVNTISNQNNYRLHTMRAGVDAWLYL